MTTKLTHNFYKNNVLKISGIIILGFLIFIAGAYAGTKPALAKLIAPATQPQITQSVTAQGQDLSQFWYIWNLMQQKYPFTDKAPADADKVYGAIKGLVSSYKDPYTVFFPPQESKLFGDQIKGSFGGVGMEVGVKNGAITVIAPMKGSPAEKAGIKSGDIITAIGTKKTDLLDIDTVISMIRGDIGTTVDLSVIRKGSADLLHFSIVRSTVAIPVIDTSEKGDVFIINFYSFSEDSATLFQQALQKFNATGKHKLVIDLRNNPGGYLDAAVDIASYFLPAGTTVVRENSGAGKNEQTDVSKGFSLLSTKPQIAVLINGGSASASEILSGALSENNAATLVGTTSFGKGSVQQVIDLDDGSSIKITVAKWYTPKGVSISEKGITPAVVVEDNAVLNKKTGKYSDPQLDAAIHLLDK
jgi:carboxyl-terminal processing protease